MLCSKLSGPKDCQKRNQTPLMIFVPWFFHFIRKYQQTVRHHCVAFWYICGELRFALSSWMALVYFSIFATQRVGLILGLSVWITFGHVYLLTTAKIYGFDILNDITNAAINKQMAKCLLKTVLSRSEHIHRVYKCGETSQNKHKRTEIHNWIQSTNTINPTNTRNRNYIWRSIDPVCCAVLSKTYIRHQSWQTNFNDFLLACEIKRHIQIGRRLVAKVYDWNYGKVQSIWMICENCATSWLRKTKKGRHTNCV